MRATSGCPASPYANDRDHSLSLLAATCLEQQGRFHTLQLLTEYLGCCAGRKRQIVAAEIKALQESYEATWCELACAFPVKLIRWSRAAVEHVRLHDTTDLLDL